MNKYTFQITLKNGDEIIKTFEALTLILANDQLKQYFKNDWLDFSLLVAKRQNGHILFDKKEFNRQDLDFDSCVENEQNAKDLLYMYESNLFKFGVIAIILAAVCLGIAIGHVISR